MVGPPLYFEDVDIGDTIGPVARVVTDAQVGDFVKIWRAKRAPRLFTDPGGARQAGLPGPIVPGAISTALLSQLLTGWAQTATLKKLDVVFRQVVLHDLPLKLKGIVTDKSVVNWEHHVGCDVFMEDGKGSPLVMGRATVVLPSRGLATRP